MEGVEAWELIPSATLLFPDESSGLSVSTHNAGRAPLMLGSHWEARLGVEGADKMTLLSTLWLHCHVVQCQTQLQGLGAGEEE